MLNNLKRFWNEEEGMGTVELIIIIGVLVAVALIFRKAIVQFVNNLINKFFQTGPASGVTSDTGSFSIS